MKIVLDNIVFSLQKVGGISVYWYELYSRILRNNYEISFIDRNNENLIAEKSDKLGNEVIDSGIKYLIFDRFVNLKLKSIKTKFIFHSSYFRITSNKYAKQVVTVHDFTHEKFHKGIRRILHSYQKGKAIKKADAIIVISQNTKKDFLTYFPQIDKNKIHVIYNGVSNNFFHLKSSLVSNDILFVGQRGSYKNFDFAVKAVAQNKNFNLKIVGGKLAKIEKRLLEDFLPGRWEIFNNINDEKLNELYNTSFALIYPSSYEGFGIPLVEAMKCGCPFIALNSSSIPEVAGNAGVLMDSLEISLFNQALCNIKENRDEIINKGFQQALKFSWDKCYEQTLSVYKKVLE
ncbi:glycosyltransferase family 4 protein [Flavobacterium plurextorum]|uniref:glycosyltransferase family 4 protein n=1 Tax=Flavobacterium plurextorum TaxID=1114867 RepID=UPI0037579EB9